MNKATMSTIRWFARISGTLLTLFCLVIAIAIFIDELNKTEHGHGLALYNIILFSIMGVGLAALILAWWKEGVGGIISFISFIVFNILAAINPVDGSRYIFILLVFFIPSILFLIYWWQKRKSLENASSK